MSKTCHAPDVTAVVPCVWVWVYLCVGGCFFGVGGCVGVWTCGYVGVWACGSVGVWMCECVGVRV